MNILERLLSVFDGRRRTLLGAVGHPNDIMSYLYVVRAQTYQRITGKSLTHVQKLPSNDSTTTSDLKKPISPSRRFLRRGL